MVVIVNPTAGEGRAARRWRHIEPDLRRRYGNSTVHVLRRPGEIHSIVRCALAEDQRIFVAAGGDGTVQLLLQALLESVDRARLADICLGAIGIGSSNDFHKPCGEWIHGVPCKLNYAGARPRDIGLLEYEDEGIERSAFWLLNSGVGITAEANAFFNYPADATLSRLKRVSTPIAILYAALRTLVKFRSQPIQMFGPFGVEHVRVANLAVVKSPHCGGYFRYDSPMDLSSRSFNLHLCEDVSLPRLLYTIWRLSAGRFVGPSWTRSWSADRIQICAEDPLAIEFDGEVVFSHRAVFSVLPNYLMVCP